MTHITIPHGLFHPNDRNSRRQMQRRAEKGTLTQPFPGFFITTNSWNQMSKTAQCVERILAVARQHPRWVVSATSAAAILGAPIAPRFHRFIHFAADKHTSSKQRETLPIRFHYIENCRPKEDIEKFLANYRDLNDAHKDSKYYPINDTVGISHGVLVTSPLQTIFDSFRMLPFEQALEIGDFLVREYGITKKQLLNFFSKRHRCWKALNARFKSLFIDEKSENGGESFCRARILREGFVQPILQKSIPNPLFKLARDYLPSTQNTRTLRPDFMWEIPQKNQDSGFKHIVAELDGEKKYRNRAMLQETGAKDAVDVVLREKDRETALQFAKYMVVRFRFHEAYQNDGKVMLEKLHLAGVPMVNPRERTRRARLMARFLGDPTLHRFE